MTVLKITGLHRDVFKDRAFVSLEWEDDPEKHLGLQVPHDCTPDQLKAEAEKAVRALAEELASATIKEA
jgi:hypothetical protein